ncbi:hypothetical protein CMU26_05760 [Elizabethkingia anophelis]|nr:hypothetical protein [Elizabethkingia anophelis]
MFGTQMHTSTFVYIVITTWILIGVIRNIYIEKNSKKYHKDFLFLSIAVLMNNLSSGLLPDDNISINILSQNIIAYTIGFSTIVYCVYYISKYYDINFRKYLSFENLFLFLGIDLIIGFILPYTITHNLYLSRNIFLIIPLVFAIFLTIILIRNMKANYLKYGNIVEKYHTLTGVIGIISILSVPITMVMFGDNQIIEQTLFSIGFFFIAIEYFLSQKNPHELSAQAKYGLTVREAEILQLIKLSPLIKYSEIGDKLNISEKTVSAHMSRIKKKVGARTRNELLDF